MNTTEVPQKQTPTFKEGQGIELHPGTDQWMMGARFGTVVKTDHKTGLVHVRMDNLRNILKCKPDHILVKDPKKDHGFIW